MKKALILHGTDSTGSSNWFPWLQNELTKLGYEVWVPDLPEADQPSIERYNEFLLNSGWTFDDDTVVVGHSSGAVEILGLLNDPNFPRSVVLKACFLVGAFKGDLGWESLKGMAGNFDYAKISGHCSRFVFVHSDDDPYCPIADARDLCLQLGGKFFELKVQGHFSYEANKNYDKFPKLLEIIRLEASA